MNGCRASASLAVRTIPKLQRLSLHFLPDAAFLLPVIEWFAVDFVHGRFRDAQLAPFNSHEEINVVHFAVGTFHIHTGKVFVPAQAGEAIIVNFDEVQREILPVIRHVKLLVGGFR